MEHIDFDQIQPGDVIAVLTRANGVATTHVGQACRILVDTWFTEDSGVLAQRNTRDQHVLLLDRDTPPEPELPVTPVPQIIATEVRETRGCWEMALAADGLWSTIDLQEIGGRHYFRGEEITEWEPIKGNA